MRRTWPRWSCSWCTARTSGMSASWNGAPPCAPRRPHPPPPTATHPSAIWQRPAPARRARSTNRLERLRLDRCAQLLERGHVRDLVPEVVDGGLEGANLLVDPLRGGATCALLRGGRDPWIEHREHARIERGMNGGRIHERELHQVDATLAREVHQLPRRLVGLPERHSLAHQRLRDVRRLRGAVGDRMQAPLGI